MSLRLLIKATLPIMSINLRFVSSRCLEAQAPSDYFDIPDRSIHVNPNTMPLSELLPDHRLDMWSLVWLQ